MVRLYELELETICPYGTDPEADLALLLSACRERIPDFNEELIRSAFYFVVDTFKHIKRSSGIPYYTHLLKVALSLLREFKFGDNESVAAALLHDAIEDIKGVTTETIREKFGDKVAEIVDGVTKIRGTKTRAIDKASTYEKLFQALIDDIRVMIIKLADRLDNMRTLQFLPVRKQQIIAHETLNFYTPFAQRLGLTRIKKILEDLGLYFTDRTAYDDIHSGLLQKRIEFVKYIENFHDQIRDKLNEREISHTITIEHKHVFEIYKMIEDGKVLGEIDNFYSMVIVLDANDYAECYKTYGIIANVFGPVSSLNDFIAKPKINFYRALHSTHLGPGRKTVEVIIRTQEMDKIVEGGIAALFDISRTEKALRLNKDELHDWLDWMHEIIRIDPEDAIQKIWGTIRMNLYEDQITVFTNEGVPYNLPKGSCPVDLAFAISDETGFHCISVKVNSQLKSLRYELKENDRVQIITSPKSVPEHDWDDYIVTHKAIIKLFRYFRNYPKEKNQKFAEKKNIEVKFRVIGEDRPGMLNEITNAIGKINIMRINLYRTSNAVFEGAFTLTIQDIDHLNNLFTQLLSIKGLRGIERIEEGEEEN